MRPSLVHDASTFGESRAFRIKFTRRLVRFSVMTMCVPFLSFRLLVKMVLASTCVIGRELDDHGAWVASAGRFRRSTAHAMAAVDAASVWMHAQGASYLKSPPSCCRYRRRRYSPVDHETRDSSAGCISSVRDSDCCVRSMLAI